MGLDVWIWMGGNPFLGPIEGVGPKISMALATFVAISGPNPYNGPCNGYCPPQNHFVPRHKNNRYINTYKIRIIKYRYLCKHTKRACIRNC